MGGQIQVPDVFLFFTELQQNEYFFRFSQFNFWKLTKGWLFFQPLNFKAIQKPTNKFLS